SLDGSVRGCPGRSPVGQWLCHRRRAERRDSSLRSSAGFAGCGVLGRADRSSMLGFVARVSFGLSFAAVGLSLGSFAAAQFESDSWQLSNLNRAGYVLVALAVALALFVNRRSAGAWQVTGSSQVQVAAAVLAVAFVIVAIVK